MLNRSKRTQTSSKRFVLAQIYVRMKILDDWATQKQIKFVQEEQYSDILELEGQIRKEQ